MHFYDPKTGEPRHFVPKKDGSGMRPSTIADCKKHGWTPSVTTVLQTLAKPGLQQWIIMQNVMAALTTPRRAEESLDDFASRIMSEDAEGEALKARSLGTDIHSGLEALFSGGQIDEELRPWIEPAYREVRKMCPKTVAVEHILIGNGYAGKVDFIGGDGNGTELIFDFKSAKKLPDRPWFENTCQLAAYARARQLQAESDPFIKTLNVYISTTDPGKFLIHQYDWQRAWTAFEALLKVWKIMNNYE